MDYDGIVLLHGANAKLIGKNLINLKDSNGTSTVRECIRLADLPPENVLHLESEFCH